MCWGCSNEQNRNPSLEFMPLGPWWEKGLRDTRRIQTKGLGTGLKEEVKRSSSAHVYIRHLCATQVIKKN